MVKAKFWWHQRSERLHSCSSCGVFTVYMMGWWQSAVWQRKGDALGNALKPWVLSQHYWTPNAPFHGNYVPNYKAKMLQEWCEEHDDCGPLTWCWGVCPAGHWHTMQTKTRKIFSQGLIQEKHFNKLVERIKSRWGLTSKRDKAECGRHGRWQKAKQQWETRNPRNHLTSLFGKNNTGASTQFTPDYSQQTGREWETEPELNISGLEEVMRNRRGTPEEGSENRVSHAQPAQTRATRQTNHEGQENTQTTTVHRSNPHVPTLDP